jgi:signal transduction histidine kinase
VKVLPIDWGSKLQHLLQVSAFCILVGAVQIAFQPQLPWGPPVVYSMAIGLTIWAAIDIGRHFIASAAETGWPTGWQGVLLVGGGIVAGYVIGNALGDALCRTFNLFPPGVEVNRANHVRNGILITAVAGVIGSYWFYARSKGEYLLREMRQAKRHAEEARLKVLETQLEPHMLFNTLANLRALIGVDPQRAQQMLDHMIAYLRATLDASRATTHPLRIEFDRLQDYLELMAIRMGPRLSYALDLPADLAETPVPTLLLQPLVENSIQHGLEPKVEGGRIDVRARRDGERLVIEVRDTGVGAASKGRDGKGFGLAQIRDRLAALHGGQASLEFQRDADGAQARIALPIA